MCSIRSIALHTHQPFMCAQNPKDRPSMSNVVVMLGSESALPQPTEPAFLTEKYFLEADSSSKLLSSSTNEISVTMLELVDHLCDPNKDLLCCAPYALCIISTCSFYFDTPYRI